LTEFAQRRGIPDRDSVNVTGTRPEFGQRHRNSSAMMLAELPPHLRVAELFMLQRILLSTLLILAGATSGLSQTRSLQELKREIVRLVDDYRHTEALPLLRELVEREPANSEAHYYLGFSWMAQAANVADEAERKALLVRGREAFLKAKELGSGRENLDGLIASIPPDGSTSDRFSQNVEAHAWMVQAEAFFGQGKLQDALRAYQKALELDPRLYEAALFSGDVYLKENDFAQAENWYQKAIDINPNRETAYRYSATPFMRQGRTKEALARYVEAYITEPYSNFSQGGLAQWARVTNTRLAHPAIEIPVTVTASGAESKITIDPAALSRTDDGSPGWIIYGGMRAEWKMKKFAETFPRETNYRHSVAEEADALRAVLIAARDAKTLSPSLAMLKKLDNDDLLEAYILMARPDQGIAQDHAAYLKDYRDKLRRYVMDYVVTGGGR
jgi:tetratricopeptide (TPR) repeat protein